MKRTLDLQNIEIKLIFFFTIKFNWVIENLNGNDTICSIKCFFNPLLGLNSSRLKLFILNSFKNQQTRKVGFLVGKLHEFKLE